MDGGEGAGARALLGLGCARAGGALGAGQDAAGGDDQDVAVGEFLLELTGETVVGMLIVGLWENVGNVGDMFGNWVDCRERIPLLNLVEAWEERNWHEDDDSLLSLTDFDL